MSEIPSAIAGSAVQAGFQAFEAAKDRDARRVDQANAVTQQARGVDEFGNTVDTDDADSQVFTDAEGAGSQGRAFDDTNDEDEQEASPEEPAANPNPALGADGRPHLDVQA